MCFVLGRTFLASYNLRNESHTALQSRIVVLEHMKCLVAMDESLIPGRPTEMCSNPGSFWCPVTLNRPISQLSESESMCFSVSSDS